MGWLSSNKTIWSRSILVLYLGALVIGALLGVYSHVLGGIFVLACLVFRDRLKKIVNRHGADNFKSYIVVVIIFEIIWESLLWVGGFRLIEGISITNLLIGNIPFWTVLGVIYYYLGSRFKYSTAGLLVLTGLLGPMIENIPRMGVYPPWMWITLFFVNGVNYSFVLGFPFWLKASEGKVEGGKGLSRYIPGIVLPYLFFWFYWFTFVAWFHGTFYPGAHIGP